MGIVAFGSWCVCVFWVLLVVSVNTRRVCANLGGKNDCVGMLSGQVCAHVKHGFVCQSTKPNLFTVVFVFSATIEQNRADGAKRVDVYNGQLPKWGCFTVKGWVHCRPFMT